MPVLIGDGTPKEMLLEQVKAVRNLKTGEGEGFVERAVMHPEFKVADTPQTILTVSLTPVMLGLELNAHIRNVLDPNVWMAWCNEHVPGYCLDNNPPEVALRMALQYEGNRKEYENFVIVIDPIRIDRNDWMFSIGNDLFDTKTQNFGVTYASKEPISSYHSNLEFFFQLRKL